MRAASSVDSLAVWWVWLTGATRAAETAAGSADCWASRTDGQPVATTAALSVAD